MLAISTMGADATAFFYVVAFFALAVGAVLAYTQRAFVLALIAVGLALFMLVQAWNAVAVA